jgi:uncharacterized RDD family membrane protein YckC
MTTPTPDAFGNITAGYYHAEGDPPETVRYWDGTQWTGQPMPPPPGTMPAAGGGFTQDRFGSVGIRIAAAILDVIFTVVIAIAFVIPLVALDIADDTGDATVGSNFNASGLVVAAIAIVVNVFFVRQFGGTPGKLVLGLRITDADAVTTPPSLQAAVMRVIPIAVLTNIPILGALAGLVILIMCIVWVSGDAERRSVYDRIGNTRVVYKAQL